MTLLRHDLITPLFIVLIIINFGCCFDIIKTSVLPSISVDIGSTVTLNCQSDEKWEYCDWWLEEVDDGKLCKFEWKRNVNDVRKQECTLSDRARYSGNYESHECNLVLSNVQPSDSGNWNCRMEEHATVFAGHSEKRTLKLQVGSSTSANSDDATSHADTTGNTTKGTSNGFDDINEGEKTTTDTNILTTSHADTTGNTTKGTSNGA